MVAWWFSGECSSANVLRRMFFGECSSANVLRRMFRGYGNGRCYDTAFTSDTPADTPARISGKKSEDQDL